MLADPLSKTQIAVAIWRELKHISGNVTRQGWRPAFCWVGVFIPLWAYIIAPREGLVIDLGQVNMFASIVLGAFITRAVEKAKGAA